jgi:hypothetical protein
MKTKMALMMMALAIVCLSLPPTLAAPSDMGNRDGGNNASFQKGGFGGQNDWTLLVDDATIENFDNMTLRQIKDLREAKMNVLSNMTAAQTQELNQNHMDKLNNMTISQIRKMNMEMMGLEMVVDSPMENGNRPQAPMGPENGKDMSDRGPGAGGSP